MRWATIDVRHPHGVPLGSRRCRVLLIVALLASSSAVVTFAATALASVDAPVDAGDVVVVAANQEKEVFDGDSNSHFSLRLPAGASCPGDSANDDWRVQSFVVPATLDPGALTYGALRPRGENLHALYGADTRPFIQVLTGQNSGPGESGLIVGVPPLSFAVFPAGMLPAGRYRIGIACTWFEKTASYWDTELILSAAPDVEPGQFRWRVADAPATAPTAESNRPWAMVGVGALAAAIVALTITITIAARRRSAPRHRAAYKEQR